MTARPAIRLQARIQCPRCRHAFEATWTPQTRAGASQVCPSCGHAFPAAWPGWRFEPQVVTVDDSAS
jgi:DNA-directed RNA polymerase subunit RPC12/RpoP